MMQVVEIKKEDAENKAGNSHDSCGCRLQQMTNARMPWGSFQIQDNQSDGSELTEKRREA